ncbi:MAG: hypothetical protein K2N51_15050 [Lachnospiraceae bacterium]|nr:hypothetical protein [Lachnospiraceae bacterium]
MIDTKEFVPLESRWQDIYMHLKNKGYIVYAPGTKTGDCTEPYVVVKNDGGYRHVNFSSNRDMYAIMCYVPKGQYSKLEPMVQNIIKDMKELEPMIQNYGQQLPSYYDDTYKAHYITIEYENYKKI